MQNILTLDKLHEKALSSLKDNMSNNTISIEDFKILLKRTENWINEIKNILNETPDPKIRKSIQNKIDIFTILETIDKDSIKKLSENQIEGLKMFRKFLIENDQLTADLVQNRIFSMAKETLKIAPKRMFEALYLVILGKKSGPRLGSFIVMLDKDWLIDRLNQIEN